MSKQGVRVINGIKYVMVSNEKTRNGALFECARYADEKGSTKVIKNVNGYGVWVKASIMKSGYTYKK